MNIINYIIYVPRLLLIKIRRKRIEAELKRIEAERDRILGSMTEAERQEYAEWCRNNTAA